MVISVQSEFSKKSPHFSCSSRNRSKVCAHFGFQRFLVCQTVQQDTQTVLFVGWQLFERTYVLSSSSGSSRTTASCNYYSEHGLKVRENGSSGVIHSYSTRAATFSIMFPSRAVTTGLHYLVLHTNHRT